MKEMEAKEKMSNNLKIVSATEYLKTRSHDELLEGVMHVETTAWPPELQATVDKFISRLNIFPEGFMVAEDNGKIEGFTTSQITNYDPVARKTWDDFTDSGTIVRSHNSSGDSLYVVSVAVASEAQGKGVGTKLIESQKDLVKGRGLQLLFLGARIPGYDEYCKKNGDINAEDYIHLKDDKGLPVDPEIRFYGRYGLQPKKVIPEFEPDDPSRNYGVVMVWENPQATSK